MKTRHSSFFIGKIQGMPTRPSETPTTWNVVAGLLLLLLAGVLAPGKPVLADGGTQGQTYGPPPALPSPAGDEDDTPRRDVHIGNVDNMRLGRDDEGNVIMEIRPRPKQVQDQPQVGPFFIYPQVGIPGQPMGGQPMPMGGQPGRMGQGGQMGQPGRQGQPGQNMPMAGPSGAPGQGMPAGNRQGQTGQTGPSGGQQPQAGQGAPIGGQPGANQPNSGF
jgi:hypothetical protein